MCMFQKISFFHIEKKIEKKNFALQVGVVPPGSPPGGCRGGVGREKKSSQKNIESEPPKKVPEKNRKKKLMPQTSYTLHMGVFQKNTFFHIGKKK